ncbi:MAG: IS1595 family transposase [Candidatus Pacebacteria bacterium]|nr:IS1595 family transposase [Candidatus Paceibacterota bacterium]MBP9840118.1 IS1595 family transposase [Candidatus Paceibacterota bacterium]
MSKYGLSSLKRDFPTDAVCLDFIFDSLHSRECSCGGTYRRISGRKQYQCSKCRFQIAPTAGTIFHKSDTPLSLWFHALWVFSNAKSGISAKEMERQLEVTYKTAWRMLKLIRESLGKQTPKKLSGVVEVDSTYMGGKGDGGKDNMHQSRNIRAKSPVIGAVQRNGEVRTKVVPDIGADTHGRFLRENVEEEGTALMTDATKTLDNVAIGYERYMVNHSKKEWARGPIYINTIEAYWAHVKRSLRGTYKVVSKRHLQGYLDAYSFHWNNRHSDSQRFSALLGTVLLSKV